MIIDKLLSPAIQLSLDDLTVSTQTLGEVMDFGVARNNGLLAKTYGPAWDINVRGATSGGAATLALALVTDDNAALSSATTLFSISAVALASLVKYDALVSVPDSDSWERYVAWRATVGTAVFTGGIISIEYVTDARRWRAYPAQGNR